jgi:hypothetical protein
MAMSRSCRRRIAWLAIVALLFNALAVLAPTKALQAVDDILGPLVICTQDGAQGLADDGGSPQHPNSTHCPSCTLAKHVILLIAMPAAEFAVPSRSEQELNPTPAARVAGHLRPGCIRSPRSTFSLNYLALLVQVSAVPADAPQAFLVERQSCFESSLSA